MSNASAGTVIAGWFKNLTVGVVTSLFTHTLSTIATFVSIIGGFAATNTFLGDATVGVVHWLHWSFSYGLLALALVLWFGDLGRDGHPEALAIFLPLFIPSFAESTPEADKLHDFLTGWIDSLNVWLEANVGEWIGSEAKDGVMTVITVIAIVFACTAQFRYLKKKGAAAASTTSSTTTSAPVRSRRARP